MWQTITGWRHGESWGQEGNIECIISITWMGTLELMLCHLWTCLLVTLPPSSAQPAEWWENGRGSAAGDCRVSPCPRDGDQMMLWCDATLLLLIQLSNQLLAHDYNQQSADQVSQWRHLNPQLTSEWRLRNVTFSGAQKCQHCFLRWPDSEQGARHAADQWSVSAAITPEKSIRPVQLMSRVTLASYSDLMSLRNGIS